MSDEKPGTTDASGGSRRKIARLLPSRLRENLTAKLLTVLLLGALVSAALGVAAFTSVSGELTTQVEHQAGSATALQAGVYGSWFESKWESLETVESGGIVQSGLSEVMEQTASGDLTYRLEPEGENAAMDRIATEFNGMVDELEKTVGQLTGFADEVAESGTVVQSSAESVRDAAEQVAESVQTISDDAVDQQERLEALSEDLDAMVATLETFQNDHPEVDLESDLDDLRDVAADLQDTAETSERVMAESQTVAGAAEEQAAELNEVSERARELKRYAKPLGDVLGRFETDAEHEFVYTGGPSQLSEDD